MLKSVNPHLILKQPCKKSVDPPQVNINIAIFLRGLQIIVLKNGVKQVNNSKIGGSIDEKQKHGRRAHGAWSAKTAAK